MPLSDIERPVDYLIGLCARSEIQKLVLFGSRARGDNGPRSDIDIAVFAPPLSFSESSKLMDAISRAPTLLKIDAVLVSPQTDQNLLESIKKEGIILFSRRGE